MVVSVCGREWDEKGQKFSSRPEEWTEVLTLWAGLGEVGGELNTVHRCKFNQGSIL